jgi:hypothetical protein
VKHQTSVKGYWQGSDKVFIDNIELIICNNQKALKTVKDRLFNNGELAVLYREGNKAIIEDKKGDKTILNKRLEFKYKKGYKNIQQIKDIIKKFNGCTVYNKKGYILIEVYTN